MSGECGGPHSSDEGSPPTTLSGCCGWLPHYRPSRKRSAVKHEGGVQKDVSSIAAENLPSRSISVLPPPPLILNSEQLDVINTQPASFYAPPYTSSCITASPGRSLLAIIDSHSRNTSNLPCSSNSISILPKDQKSHKNSQDCFAELSVSASGRHSHGLRSSAGISSALSDRLSANTSRGRGGSRHSYRSDRYSLGLRSSAGEGGTSALFFQTRSSTGNGNSLSRLSDHGNSLSRLSDHGLRVHDASVRKATTSDADDDTSSLASALVTGWLQDQGGQLSNVLEHPDTSDLAKVDFAETAKEMQMESYEDIYQRHDVGVLPGMSIEEGEVQTERDSVRGAMSIMGRSLSVEAPISNTSAFAPHLTPSDHTPSHPTSALLSQNALLPSSASVPTTSSSGAFVRRSVGSAAAASKPSNLKAGGVIRGSRGRPWSRLNSHDTATTQQEQQQQQDATSAHSHLRRPASHHHASSNRTSRPSVTFAALMPDTSIRHSGGHNSQAERTMPGYLDTTPGSDPSRPPGMTGVESSAYSNMASPSILLGPRLAASRTLQMLLGVSFFQSAGDGTRRHTNRSSGSAVSSSGAAPTTSAAVAAGGHRKDFVLKRFTSGRVTPQPEWAGSASHMEGYEEPVVNASRPSAPGSVNASRPSAPGSVNARPSAPGSVNARPSAPGSLPLRRPPLVTDRSGEIVAESSGFGLGFNP